MSVPHRSIGLQVETVEWSRLSAPPVMIIAPFELPYPTRFTPKFAVPRAVDDSRPAAGGATARPRVTVHRVAAKARPYGCACEGVAPLCAQCVRDINAVPFDSRL